jgi:hypothetical protein
VAPADRQRVEQHGMEECAEARRAAGAALARPSAHLRDAARAGRNADHRAAGARRVEGRADGAHLHALGGGRPAGLCEHDPPAEEIGPSFFTQKYSRLLGPSAELGQFVANYGYDMKEAMESRKRVLQQYNLSDDYLRAVESLKGEMTRTTEAMNMCRDSVQ